MNDRPGNHNPGNHNPGNHNRGNHASGVTAQQYVIPAKESLAQARPSALKHDDTFAIFDPNGDIAPVLGGAEGLYHRDTRHLSDFALTLHGARLIVLSAAVRDDNAGATCDLTNPDLAQDERMLLAHDTLHLRRSRFLWQGTLYERIAVRSFAEIPLDLMLELRFAADFADLFEVRGQRRRRRGRIHAPVVGPASVGLAYTGLDRNRRTTELRFEPAPARISRDRATWRLDLQPGGQTLLYVELRCNAPSPQRPPRELFLVSSVAARRAQRQAANRSAAVETSNEVFNEALRRDRADLAMLTTETPHGPYPYAGIPWFSAAFGRDAIITALQLLWLDPSIAGGVLRYLAANQAQAADPVADAEPGKILHEVRHGEMAELGEVPFRRYYGSVDATPLFVMLAGAHLGRTGDRETARALWPAVRSALDWMDRHGDRDGDGFIEYHRMTEKGLANQGWKDSHDSVFHADGSAAAGPIALVEVQGYAYAARLAAAAMARALGEDGAEALEASAERLRLHFEAAFWCEGLGTYALALDGAKRPCAVSSSNAGHALLTRIASPERAARVAAELGAERMFSGWGIRTLSTTEARYNPISYHNGSVWPHDNALIGMGLAAYGHRGQSARILDGLFAASTAIELRRLPELFCGFSRRPGRGPTFYPVACSPQAWAAATPFGLLAACLGLGFDPGRRMVTFDRPVLPRFIDWVELRGLAIGPAWIDVALRRERDGAAMSVLRREGEISASMTS
jgi:glycogen debranching enzyme